MIIIFYSFLKIQKKFIVVLHWREPSGVVLFSDSFVIIDIRNFKRMKRKKKENQKLDRKYDDDDGRSYLGFQWPYNVRTLYLVLH